MRGKKTAGGVGRRLVRGLRQYPGETVVVVVDDGGGTGCTVVDSVVVVLVDCGGGGLEAHDASIINPATAKPVSEYFVMLPGLFVGCGCGGGLLFLEIDGRRRLRRRSHDDF